MISTDEMLAVRPVAGDHREPYGPHSQQFGDLYLPKGPGPHPVVVLVHGGCWRALAGLDYTSHLADAIRTEGWAVWNIEFRRIDQPGGAWPGILQDVADATDHLRTVAERYELDPRRVVAIGHSSGGHLALWLASRLRNEPPGGVRFGDERSVAVHGAVALAGIVDLLEFHHRQERGCGAGIVTELLGADPDHDAARLQRTSPAARLPLRVPQLLVTGTDDRTVPFAHTSVYAARARAAGDPVDLVGIPGAGHFEVVAPWSAHFEMVHSVLGAFLARAATAQPPASGSRS